MLSTKALIKAVKCIMLSTCEAWQVVGLDVVFIETTVVYYVYYNGL